MIAIINVNFNILYTYCIHMTARHELLLYSFSVMFNHILLSTGTFRHQFRQMDSTVGGSGTLGDQSTACCQENQELRSLQTSIVHILKVAIHIFKIRIVHWLLLISVKHQHLVREINDSGLFCEKVYQ